MQKQCVDTMGVSVSQRVEDNRMIRWRNFMNLSPEAVTPGKPYSLPKLLNNVALIHCAPLH